VPSPHQPILTVHAVHHPVKKSTRKPGAHKDGKIPAVSAVKELTATQKRADGVDGIQNTPLNGPSKQREGGGNNSTRSQPWYELLEDLVGTGSHGADSSQITGSESRKRKRARPSNWWAANPVDMTVGGAVPVIVTDGPKPSNSKSSSATKTTRGLSGSGNTDHTTQDSGTHDATVPQEEDIRGSKRQRAPPSDWWAAFTSTPSKAEEPLAKKQKKDAANTKSSNGALKDVPSRRNMSTIVKVTKNGDTSKTKQEIPVVGIDEKPAAKTSKLKPKQAKGQRGKLPKAFSKGQEMNFTLASDSPQQHSSARRSNGGEEIVEVETARSNFGRGRSRTNGHAGPVQEHVTETASRASKNGKKPAEAQSRVFPKDVSASQISQKKQTSAKSKSTYAFGFIEANSNIEKAEGRLKSKSARVADASLEIPEIGNPIDEISDYQHLVPVTRKVNRHTIEEKWDGLPPNCVELISQILVNSQRPVIARIGGENKRAQVNTALQMISRRLLSKISKGLPFPKAVGRQREDDFDFEKIIDRNRRLEGQLTSEIDANKLLDESLTKELARLQSEKDTLATLEANAKTESALRKTASGKFHPLLQSAASEDVKDLEDSSDLGASRVMPSLGVNLIPANTFSGSANFCQISTDENLQTVVRDLEGHVDSLQGNFKPLSGLPEAMTRARAAVQIVIHDRLGSERCQDVVLGA
jgi:hypothetical protein